MVAKGAIKANKAYREMLVESRVGANITEDELLALDEIVSPLVMCGQSVHHIIAHNPDQFEVSEKSIYRYVAGGLLKARNIDMPHVCRTKPRKSKPVEHKVDSSCRIELLGADRFKALFPVIPHRQRARSFQTRRHGSMKHRLIAGQGYITATPVHHSRSPMWS